MDEFFREDIGSILYPVKEPAETDTHVVIENIRERIRTDTDWTMFSVRDLALDICVKNHFAINTLFDSVTKLSYDFPGYVAFIPTSRSFASITARSITREVFELRGYLKEKSGRFISHIRLHRELRRLLNG